MHRGENGMTAEESNGAVLRGLIEKAGMTQLEALELVNVGQAKPIAVSTWKAYLASRESKRWRDCRDTILVHAESRLAADSRDSIATNQTTDTQGRAQ
nr:hypothetical protein [Pseudomonas aeruginosa]